MAVRIQNGAVVNFGTFVDETTVTHARLRVGSSLLTTRQLNNARTVAAGGQAQFNVGDIDLVFPAGEFENAGLNALLALALDGSNAITIDAMTSSNNVVNTSGYSQQATANWSRSNEVDLVEEDEEDEED